MRNLIFFTLCLTLISCGGVKQTQKKLATGNYNTAINDLVDKLRKGKTKKKSYEHILLLEEAYKKAVERDERNLERLKTDTNPNSIRQIYETYVQLEKRQKKIRPLLPLYITTESRDATFKINDYARVTLDTRDQLSNYLYRNATNLLKSEGKQQARDAYNDLEYINKINPNYKNTLSLMERAHSLGSNYILLHVKNASEKVIPKRLEKDLLNIDSYKLNQFWAVYQNNKLPNLHYDYDLVISFEQIFIGPEQIKEKEIIQVKTIKDGFYYVLDSNGNVKKDSLGNDIKREKKIQVRSKVSKISQFKSVTIQAKATYYVSKTNQVVESFPIASQFVFEHHYASHRGDKRALANTYLRMIRRKRVPFPSNEELIYETGEDIKRQLSNIIRRKNSF